MKTTRPIEPEQLLTPREVADALKVDRRTLEGWRRARRGPAFLRLSHTAVRYRVSAVADYLSSVEAR